MFSITSKQGEVLFERAKVAASFKDRLKGLIGKKSIASDEALFFNKCSSVHMFGMRFPIDVIYLNHQLEIIKIENMLSPWSFSSFSKATSLVEVRAGQCQKLGLKVGDRLTLKEVNENDQS